MFLFVQKLISDVLAAFHSGEKDKKLEVGQEKMIQLNKSEVKKSLKAYQDGLSTAKMCSQALT